MRVKEVMTTSVVTAGAERTLKEVAEEMREHDVGFLPIVENEQVIGLVTDRDLVTRGLAAGTKANAPVREILTPTIWTVYENDAIGDLAARMSEKRVRRMIVLNGEDRPVGVVTLGDLAHHGDRETASEVLETVSDPATPKRIDSRTEALPSFATGVQ